MLLREAMGTKMSSRRAENCEVEKRLRLDGKWAPFFALASQQGHGIFNARMSRRWERVCGGFTHLGPFCAVVTAAGGRKSIGASQGEMELKRQTTKNGGPKK